MLPGGDSLLCGLLEATTSAKLQIRGLTVSSLLEFLVVLLEVGDTVDPEAGGGGAIPGGRKGIGAQGGGDPELDGGLVSLCLSNTILCG